MKIWQNIKDMKILFCLVNHAEENGEEKGKTSMHGQKAQYIATTNEPKNKFQNRLQQRKTPSEKNVYKYKLRIKQLLLKQVSNVDDFLFVFLVVSVFVSYVHFIGTFLPTFFDVRLKTVFYRLPVSHIAI